MRFSKKNNLKKFRKNKKWKRISRKLKNKKYKQKFLRNKRGRSKRILKNEVYNMEY